MARPRAPLSRKAAGFRERITPCGGERRLEPLLERLETQLLEAEALDVCEGLARELSQRRAAPQSKSLLECVQRLSRLAPRLREETAKTLEVELLGLELEDVPSGSTRQDVSA